MTDAGVRRQDQSFRGPLAALLEHSQELLLLLDGDLRLGWLSPAAQRFFGPDAGEAPLIDAVHPAERAGVAGVAAAGHGETDCRLRDATGNWHPVRLTFTDQRTDATIGAVVCLARMLAPTEAAARLLHQATHDTLTALPNRAHLLQRLAGEPGPAGPAPCALFYIDLDGFKAVNDTFGHAAGDRVLVAVAERLRRIVRPGDTVARLGGDEFIVVAAEVADAQVALDIAYRIVARICRPISVTGRLVSISASVGVALGPDTEAGRLLEEADTAMYHAKRDGRNRAALFVAGMRHETDRRAEVESMLREALDGGMRVYYQPIVDLGTRAVAGAEAQLRLRMRAVDGHVAGSEEFLDVAESTGLAVPVGTGLLDHACGEIARWTRELGPAAPGMVSVPCSSRQLRGRRAAAQVAAVIANHGVRASSLCLEISEASLVDADDTVRRTLEELKTSGVRLAIDDFGGGRTSLTSLRHFGIDMIRIDRSLLTGLGEGGDTEVVRAVVGLGHALGITTIAKGVDSEAQAGALAGIGCELAQGNLFGPARERVLSS